MADRTIRLDLDMPGLDRWKGAEAGTHADPGQEDSLRFREALRDGGEGAEDSESPSGEHAAESAGGPLPGAFGLFGARATGVPAQLPARQAAYTASEIIASTAARLLVSGDGRREVRIRFQEDVLRGVEVRVGENEGRWRVDFDVSDAESLALLRQQGPDICGELASRLARAVEVRVRDAACADERETAYCFADAPSGTGGELE